MKDLQKLLYSPMLKASDVLRYSCVYMSRPEKLDSHIYEVSMISYLIAKKLSSLGEHIDIGKVLEYSLVHDLEETITGDIPRNTKHYDRQVAQALDSVADICIRDLSKYHSELSDLHLIWSNAKLGKEGIVIKIVDMLVVVRKAIIEIELYGNKEALKVILELPDHLGKTTKLIQTIKTYDCQASVEYLVNLLQEASSLIKEVSEQYAVYIEKYCMVASILSKDNLDCK